MRKTFLTIRLVALLIALPAVGQSFQLKAPPTVIAGHSFSITSSGSGAATFYLLGPSHVVKRSIHLGEALDVPGTDLSVSGLYQAIACVSSTCTSTHFQVLASSPARLSFLVHPSRVPVSTANAINATAFVFDRFNNIVLAPTTVDLRLSAPGSPKSSHNIVTHRGVAWFEMGSTAKQGPLQIVASAGDIAEPRVIQQVASEACGLRISGSPNDRSVRVQTDLVRDCSGNPLADGTVVSFTKIDDAGRSTVDAPIKKGIATAQFALSGPAKISVACGVALGNELSIGGKP